MRIILLLLCLLTTSLYADNTLIEKTISLKALTTQDSLNFIGPGASKQIFLPLPNHWQTKQVKLHLLVNITNAPEKPSSLTAFLNDQPISSIDLQSIKNAETVWDITIPINDLKTKNISILIKSGWRNNDNSNACKNFSDPSFWTTILGSSTITYQFSPEPIEPTLTAFPEPFIDKNNIFKDTLTLVLPEHFSKADLTSLFYTSQAFSNLKSWRGITLEGATPTTLLTIQKNQNNLVFIGTAKDNPLFQLKEIHWPIALNEKHEWIDKNQKKIGDDTGIVMLATSPWSPYHVVLAITGNTEVAAIKAAMLLRKSNFPESLISPSYSLIQSKTPNIQTKINWQDATFKKFGFKTQTVFGEGESTLNYLLQLPVNKKPKEIKLKIYYTASPLLSKINASFLSLSVNQHPVTGIRIASDHDSKDTWDVTINKDFLLVGQNLISLSFHLKFHNNTCMQDDDYLAWATVMDHSKIAIQFEKSQANLDFQQLNGYDQNFTLFLPDKDSYFKQPDFLKNMIALGKGMTKTNDINILNNHDPIDDQVKNTNLIYVGALTDNPQLMQVRKNFLFNFNNGVLDINPKLLPALSISPEIPVAALTLIQSPFHPDRMILDVSATQNAHLPLAINVLTNKKSLSYLKGDTVLIYSNGTFTSLNASELLKKIENKQRIHEANWTTTTGLVIFGVIFFGGLILLIIARRIHRYFSKNVK